MMKIFGLQEDEQQKNGERFIKRSFRMYTHQLIMLILLNNVGKMCLMCSTHGELTKLSPETPRKSVYLEDKREIIIIIINLTANGILPGGSGR
jgi:hypothetical protein